MVNRISNTVKQLFPDDFEEIKPEKRPVLDKVDFKYMMTGWRIWVLLIPVAIFLYGLVHYWNFVINIECAVVTATHQIEVAQQRRKNIIAELTKCVLQYAEHERGMFQYMADKRDKLKPAAADKMAELVKQSKLLGDGTKIDDAQIENFLGNFKAVAENYPHLKLSENYQILMEAMMEVTKQIADRRMAYNEDLLGYKTFIHTFPNMIYTWFLHVRDYDFAKVDKAVHLLVPLDNDIDQTKE